MSELTCFKTYDVRGEIGVDFNEEIAFRIGRAVAQHFRAKSVVIGFDSRLTSPAFAFAAAQGVNEAGADVLDIGLSGTEEMYWAVSQFGACAGMEITASHNPINYNGVKIVKSGSQPLDDFLDFQMIKALAETQEWASGFLKGRTRNIGAEARAKYVERILAFVDLKCLKSLKIVINAGNGAAGPTIDAIVNQLAINNVPFEFIRVNHKPDGTFPNGIPNPMLPKNHFVTSDVVRREGADIGVAFDGDFDRCFLFDEAGRFVPPEYIVGLLASVFLEKEEGAKIVHDPRVIWNTQDITAKKGGFAVQSKTGHAFLKKTMRAERAIYGGEMSAHHYFRDFAYCDSGMIPWLLVAEFLSRSDRPLTEWVDDRSKVFPSSGEKNFQVDDPSAAIERVLSAYRQFAISYDQSDGVSLVFSDWRFNLRQSNTEPLVRLNIESRGSAELLQSKVSEIACLLGGTII